MPLIPADHFNGTRSAELVLSNPQGASLGYPSAVLDLTANPPTPMPAGHDSHQLAGHDAHESARHDSHEPAQPGPTVVSVAPLKSRRDKTSLVITFNQALDPASAQNASNYQVSLPGALTTVPIDKRPPQVHDGLLASPRQLQLGRP